MWRMRTDVEVSEVAQQVLIIDDSEMARFALWSILTGAGYDVLEMAASSLMALETLHTNSHRLVVVMDVDGQTDQEHEIIEWLVNWIGANAALASRHAYIALSARPGLVAPEVAALLTNLSAPLVAKPIDGDALLQRVAEARQRLNGNGNGK